MTIMLLRRLLYRWQFLAAIALPGWLLVGWGVFGGSGWVFPFVLFGSLALALFLVIVSALMRARPSVHETHALSWWDVAVLVAWHLCLVGLGFFGATTGLFAMLSIGFGLAGFWYAISALLAEVGRKWLGAPSAHRIPPAQTSYRRGGDDGDVFVIHERD